jgi:hypothetical protein
LVGRNLIIWAGKAAIPDFCVKIVFFAFDQI